jgi:hypothetical protein
MAPPNPLRQTIGRKSKISKPIAAGRRHLRAAMGPSYRPPDGIRAILDTAGGFSQTGAVTVTAQPR